jgi:hypothetical protein
MPGERGDGDLVEADPVGQLGAGPDQAFRRDTGSCHRNLLT